MTAVPRLSIGLPVYNGENYLAEALEALLGQSYEDFELIISDNASTDGTAGDLPSLRKAGLTDPLCPPAAQHRPGPEPQLRRRASPGRAVQVGGPRRPVRPRPAEALRRRARRAPAGRARPLLVGNNRRSAAPMKLIKYPAATASLRAPERFRSMLFDGKGDYTYAVIRTDILRRMPLQDSYHYADRTLITEIALHGPFYQVPDWLYFRRDHPESST